MNLQMMKMNKKEPRYYLDGFIYVYRPKDVNRTTFGAKKNIRSKDEMDLLYKLAYTQSYKRLQDLDFAESMGRDLSIKVKVRLVNGIKNSDKVVIEDVLYDIIYVDEDKVNRELYLYLEEVYSIE